ncbi:NAD(P)H-dependent oxidoreductase [Chitinophaga skermanii]|nr:NAD(P)H-dependent oxidoreductase [Chitinophaga skermanii]
MKKILIIQGNPHPGSYCEALANAYYTAAQANGYDAEILHLHSLQFNLNLEHGYHTRTPWEPCLEAAWHSIQQANHLVFVYPTWWGTMPALLKGFFDRLFLPGKAFKYRDNSLFWDKYLKGKTARIVTTMDAPRWYNYFFYHDAGIRALKTATLQYCGISPVKVTVFDSVRNRQQEYLAKGLQKMAALGAAGR